MRDNSGKVLVGFLILIATLLISVTAIAVFFFVEEVKVRKAVEYNLEQMQLKEMNLEASLTDANKKVVVFEGRVKELESEIESLQGELDLAEGVRDEVKKENRELKEVVGKADEEKNKLREELSQKQTEMEMKITTLQEEVKAAVSRNKELDTQRGELESKYLLLKKQLEDNGIQPLSDSLPAGIDTSSPEMTAERPVDLDTIVVSPPTDKKGGKIISIDKETEFIIVNLGEVDGVKVGTILSIYRGNQYIGDVKVTRALPEMSAADLIPPLKCAQIQQDDKVVVKK